MYIANKTFTSKHHHDYKKDQRITNARYFFLAMEDKPNFDYHLHGSYSLEEEKDPNFGHNSDQHYYPATDVSTHQPVTIATSSADDEHIHRDEDDSLLGTVVMGALIEEMINTSIDQQPVTIDPGPSFDPTPIDTSVPDFGGGTSDGGGAGGDY